MDEYKDRNKHELTEREKEIALIYSFDGRRRGFAKRESVRGAGLSVHTHTRAKDTHTLGAS